VVGVACLDGCDGAGGFGAEGAELRVGEGDGFVDGVAGDALDGVDPGPLAREVFVAEEFVGGHGGGVCLEVALDEEILGEDVQGGGLLEVAGEPGSAGIAQREFAAEDGLEGVAVAGEDVALGRAVGGFHQGEVGEVDVARVVEPRDGVVHGGDGVGLLLIELGGGLAAGHGGGAGEGEGEQRCAEGDTSLYDGSCLVNKSGQA